MIQQITQCSSTFLTNITLGHTTAQTPDSGTMNQLT